MLEPSLISAEQPFSPSFNIGSNEFCDNKVFFAENNDPREQLLWIVNKSRIDFYKYDSDCQNQLISCFNFEEIYKDASLVISFVVRCVDRSEESHKSLHPFKVIVTVNSHHGSSVILIDIISGSVLSTIAFPYTICSVELVSGGKASSVNRPFGEALQALDGILAVGTVGGNVFLLDLRLDSLPEDSLASTQVTFSNIHKATKNEVIHKRIAAVQHQQNLAFMMNSFAKTKNHFVYTNADKKMIYDRFNAQSVYVSCLYYIPTNCSIVVGFNFGGLQMISLQTDFQLELSQELKNQVPVVAISHQLPESDPKNFIYFWVVRGIHQKSLGLEFNDQNVTSRAYLYRALYDNGNETPHGIFYSKFIQYECVFYVPLVFNPLDFEKKTTTSSRLLEMFSVSKVIDIDGAGCSTVDNRYTVIMWSAESAEFSEKVVTQFFIFDLNQYYLYLEQKCQNVLSCGYLSLYSLSPVYGLISNRDQIQGLSIQTNSMRRFLFKRLNILENESPHNSPRSLSFDVMVASQEKCFQVKFSSVQKRILKDLFCQGIDILTEPSKALKKLKNNGLISGPLEEYDENDPKFIFNAALDYQQLGFFRKNILDANPGRKDNVLNWVNDRIIATKHSIDDNSESLFDFSGSRFSPDQSKNLNSCKANLRNLKTILKFFSKSSEEYSEDSEKIAEVIDLLDAYLKLIFNLHHANILPERLQQNCYAGQTYYDGELMKDHYGREREKIMKICSSAFNDKSNVLVIDLIVEHFREALGREGVWRIDESRADKAMEDKDGALYPPANIQCLCRTFLQENDSIPPLIKEFILIYFLNDYMLFNQQYMEINSLLTFFRSNVMDSCMQDLVLGIWYIDHGNYTHALSFFTSGNTLKAFKEFRNSLPDLFREVLERIVNLFMIHKYTKEALTFIEISEIFPMDSLNESLYLYLLVQDLKLLSALDFQRRRRSNDPTLQLFQRLLEFCDQKNCLHRLCFVQLDDYEEFYYLSYLHDSDKQSRRLILVFYFLAKNRLAEALNFVSTYPIDFSELPQLSNSLSCCENIVPMNELNAINKGMITLQEHSEEIARKKKEQEDEMDSSCWGELKFDHNQPLMRVFPKKSQRVVVSRTAKIEQELRNKETFLPKVPSPVRKSFVATPARTPKARGGGNSSFYTPRVDRSSSAMKAKVRLNSSKKVKNPFAEVLKTPDVKRQILATIPAFSASRPPSALKHNIAAHDSESVHSSDSSKFKVKFRLPGRAEVKSKEPLKEVVESPAKVVNETLEKMIVETQEKVIAESAEKMIVETPGKVLAQTQGKVIAETPEKMVVERPEKMILETPEKAIAEPLKKVVLRSSRRVPGRAEVKSKEPLKKVVEAEKLILPSPSRAEVKAKERLKKVVEAQELILESPGRSEVNSKEPLKKVVEDEELILESPSRAEVKGKQPLKEVVEAEEVIPQSPEIKIRRSSRRSMTPQRFDPSGITPRKVKKPTKVTIKRSKAEK